MNSTNKQNWKLTKCYKENKARCKIKAIRVAYTPINSELKLGKGRNN